MKNEKEKEMTIKDGEEKRQWTVEQMNARECEISWKRKQKRGCEENDERAKEQQEYLILICFYSLTWDDGRD